MSQHAKTDFKHFTKDQLDAGLRLHHLEATKPSQLADGFRSGAEWARDQPAQPDCQTCTRYIYEGCGSKTICINADQYIKAPALVLWRTE